VAEYKEAPLILSSFHSEEMHFWSVLLYVKNRFQNIKKLWNNIHMYISPYSIYSHIVSWKNDISFVSSAKKTKKTSRKALFWRRFLPFFYIGCIKIRLFLERTSWVLST
jgi:hypothetical protein